MEWTTTGQTMGADDHCHKGAETGVAATPGSLEW